MAEEHHHQQQHGAAVVNSRFIMSPLFSVLSLGLACVSTIFQTIAFSGHGWAVMTQFVTDSDTGEVRSVEINTGLWYTVTCAKGACTSTTHLDAFKADVIAGRTYKEVQYSLRVWSQVLATIALIGSFFAAACCVPFLCKPARFLRYHLVIILCSLISFCLLISVVFNWTADVAANTKLKLDPNRTFYFPWSLLLAGFGAFGDLVLCVFHFVLLYRSLVVASNPSSGEAFHPNAYVQLTQISQHETQVTNGLCRLDSQCKKQVTEEKELCDDDDEEENVEDEDSDEKDESTRVMD